MEEYEISIVLTFNSEKDAKLVYFSIYPDMNIKIRNIDSRLSCKGNKIYLFIKSNSLSRLRGMVNSFFRVYKTVMNII